MKLTALTQPADFSTLSREKTEREGKGDIVHSTTAQGCDCYKISKKELWLWEYFHQHKWEIVSWDRNVSLTGTAMRVELVLFMFLGFISQHSWEKYLCWLLLQQGWNFLSTIILVVLIKNKELIIRWAYEHNIMPPVMPIFQGSCSSKCCIFICPPFQTELRVL